MIELIEIRSNSCSYCCDMGGSVSQVFQSGSALLSNGHGHKVTESTREKVQHIFEALRAKPKVPVALLEGFLQQIPKVNKSFDVNTLLSD